MFFVLFLPNRMRGRWWRTAMPAIDTRPARDKMIDLLNRVWFDLLLLSRWSFEEESIGSVPDCDGPAGWRLGSKNLPISQLVHVNSELIPHALKWKTDADFFFLGEQSHLLCSVSTRLSGVGLLIDCSLWFHVCPGVFAAACPGSTLLFLLHQGQMCGSVLCWCLYALMYHPCSSV